MAESSPQTAYDEVAYPSHPFRQTHPMKMALPAALYGLPFAAVETARVLEIGCGEGGNLIPMAVAYPRARFLGFDLAASAIAAGRRTVAALGLENIDLRALDILDAGADLGAFDYIIAHGVYSWTPEPVREGLMRLVRACLSPVGLAFVSYNALPGCHMRTLVREMVMRHIEGEAGFEARLNGAREFLQFFIAQASDDDPTAVAIKTYCRSMLERDPNVLFHDELGPVFRPFHLHEFVEAAGRHDLTFLGESEGPDWREELFPSSRGRAVAHVAGGDVIEQHQYLDFLNTRLFRQSILCGAERALDRTVDFRRIRDLWIAGGVKPLASHPDLDGPEPVRFEFASKAAIALDIPPLKRALAMIGEAWPSALPVAALPDDPDVDEGLLQLFTAGHLHLAVGQGPFAVEPGMRPLASPLARFQLERGASTLCTLDHTLVSFEDEESRAFLAMLDGRRSREDLARALTGDGRDAAAAATLVEEQLRGLGRLGLLAQ